MNQTSVQRYVSSELTHFTGGSLKEEFPIRDECEDRQYELLRKILTDQRLRPPTSYSGGPSFTMTTWPTAMICSNEMFNATMVCFCDIPIADLAIHIGKYSGFGLSFSKKFLLLQGASPVFYVSGTSAANFPQSKLSRPTTIRDSMNAIFKEYNSVRQEVQELLGDELSGNSTYPKEISSLLQRLFRLIHDLDLNVFSYIKCFDGTIPENHGENFYMEREWRVLGSVDFTLDDVSRVIFPYRFAMRFRADFPQYIGQITFADA